ncbi:MAG: hypothetical protein C0622_02090 [Desulfuromonas sp.]|nr:MAG: hypothetical protein C0622_02090 [Desulfuromonas sp.]
MNLKPAPPPATIPRYLYKLFVDNLAQDAGSVKRKDFQVFCCFKGAIGDRSRRLWEFFNTSSCILSNNL